MKTEQLSFLMDGVQRWRTGFETDRRRNSLQPLINCHQPDLMQQPDGIRDRAFDSDSIGQALRRDRARHGVLPQFVGTNRVTDQRAHEDFSRDRVTYQLIYLIVSDTMDGFVDRVATKPVVKVGRIADLQNPRGDARIETDQIHDLV